MFGTAHTWHRPDQFIGMKLALATGLTLCSVSEPQTQTQAHLSLAEKKKKKKKCFCHGALDLSPGPSASDICSFKQCNHPKLTEMINISLLSLRVRGTAREGRKRSKKKKGQSNIPIPSSAFKQIYCVG